MQIILTNEECYCGLGTFYEMVATKMGVKVTDDMRFDCMKICITKAVEEQIRSFYKSNKIRDIEIATMLVCLGPKANLTGDELKVEVEEGFILSENSQ